MSDTGTSPKTASAGERPASRSNISVADWGSAAAMTVRPGRRLRPVSGSASSAPGGGPGRVSVRLGGSGRRSSSQIFAAATCPCMRTMAVLMIQPTGWSRAAV